MYQAENCDKIITEKYTRTKSAIEELTQLKEVTRKGDDFIIESLSIFGRNTIDVLTIIRDFYNQGIAVRSLKEGIIDTSSPSGTFIATMYREINKRKAQRNLIPSKVNG